MEKLPPAQRIQVARIQSVYKSVEQGLVAAFDRFLEAWMPKLDAYLEQYAGKEADQAGPKPAVRLETRWEREARAATLEAYRTAVAAGAAATFQDLGVQGKVPEKPVAYFRTASKLHGTEAATRLTIRVRQSIATGLEKGEFPPQIRARVQAEFREAARFEAERIARTETMAAYSYGSTAAMKEAGVTRFRWLAYPGADNGDPTGPCVERNGQTFDVGDEENTPPIHPNDRCTMIPVVEAPR